VTRPLKVVFAGTPDFAAESLKALINSEHQVCAVYTQPDRPAGRGKKIVKSPVKQLAEQAEIDVIQPLDFKQPGDVEKLAGFKPDIMIVAAYGLILPQSVLDIPKFGCLNVHASLLPRWRGAAPIQRAIEAGVQESGVTIMQMALGLDTGDMLLKQAIALAPDETGGSLHDKLAHLGAKTLLKTLSDPEHYRNQAKVQDDGQANYAHKLSKQEALLDWNQPAAYLERKIRAFNPWPVCFFKSPDCKDPIRVFEASVVSGSQANMTPGTILQKSPQGIVVQCTEEALSLTQIPLPGARSVSARDFYNGGKSMLEQGSSLYVEN